MIIKVDIDKRIDSKETRDALLKCVVVVRINDVNEETAKRTSDQISEAHSSGQEIIPIIIDSYGGDIYSLMSIASAMTTSSLPIMTLVEGKAMSSGAVIASLGSPGFRYATKNATIMIHDALEDNMGGGKTFDMRAQADELERLNKKIYEMLARAAKKQDDYFLNKVGERGRADWFLTAQDAKDEGLIDHIGSPIMTINACVSYKINVAEQQDNGMRPLQVKGDDNGKS